MTEVIVAHEKHGTFTYASALTILTDRLQEGWYYDYNDGSERHQYERRARKIVAASESVKAAHSDEYAAKVERVAWAFLTERQDHEYEYVEKQTVKA